MVTLQSIFTFDLTVGNEGGSLLHFTSLEFDCIHCFNCLFVFLSFFKSNKDTIAFIRLQISLHFFLFCFSLPNLLNLNQWEFDDTTEHVSNF